MGEEPRVLDCIPDMRADVLLVPRCVLTEEPIPPEELARNVGLRHTPVSHTHPVQSGLVLQGLMSSRIMDSFPELGEECAG